MISDVGEYGIKSNWGIVNLGVASTLEKLLRELPSCSVEDGKEQVESGSSRQQPQGRPQELAIVGDSEPLALYTSTFSLSSMALFGGIFSDSASRARRSCCIKVFAVCRMGLYPVHRHRLPSKCPFISISCSERSKELVAGS